MAPNVRTLFHTPTADEVEDAPDSVFRRWLNDRTGERLRDYWELHAWSTANVERFWELLWDYGGVIGSFEPGKLFDASFPMDKPNPHLIRAKLNFAENVLLSHANARSENVAIVSLVEPDVRYKRGMPEYLASTFLRQLTFSELYDEVNKVSVALRQMGVGPGDRVSTYAPSNAEAVVLCLATAALGGVWSSCPSEFGVRATLERLTQIEPKVLLTADFYRYTGKKIPIFPRLLEILASLPSVKNVIVVGQLQQDRVPVVPFPKEKHGRKWRTWEQTVAMGANSPKFKKDIDFHRGSAMAPLYVLYSSGTTGKPKAIVHTVGGIVLASKMVSRGHSGAGPGDALLQFSTLGWMMWNSALSTLGVGTRILTYDGSPLFPLPILFDLVDEYKITIAGVSPRYLQTLATAGYEPNKHHKLDTLRVLPTAGSVLKADLYDWIRDHIGNVWINNCTGGTDICSMFIGGVRSLPEFHSEIQAPALGMQVEAWDDDGVYRKDQQGEMVITRPFPNMPLGFWGDTDGSRYKSAYFEAFKTPVWTQGDWIEISSLTGGIMVFGRSDGVLNPAGVRFGSAEIYSVVEEMRDIVEDCITVGQKILGGDERVILFVKSKPGTDFDKIVDRIRKAIATTLSPRHVPAKIIECPKIPYTGNGKKLEVATKKILNGTPFEKINLSAAEDPECLKWFIDRPELSLDAPVKAKL